MVTTPRTSRIITTICLVCAPFTGVPLAAQAARPAARSGQAPPAATFIVGSSLPARFTLKEPISSIVTLSPSEPSPLAQRGWGRGGGRDRNSVARTAVVLGSVAAIAGAAVLVYANRPECRGNSSASGCGYGAKVVGGAVLAGGAVGIAVGALSWR
jgi:hypothetical protein